MKHLIAITPADIRESMSILEQEVARMAVEKINRDLLRTHYCGPDPFECYLADHLTPAVIQAIVRPFAASWTNPRIEDRGATGLWFVLEYPTESEDKS